MRERYWQWLSDCGSVTNSLRRHLASRRLQLFFSVSSALEQRYWPPRGKPRATCQT